MYTDHEGRGAMVDHTTILMRYDLLDDPRVEEVRTRGSLPKLDGELRVSSGLDLSFAVSLHQTNP